MPAIDPMCPFDRSPSRIQSRLLTPNHPRRIFASEQYDEMKSIVEAVFARMPGSVCKRDALLKWCGEKLANYVSLDPLRREKGSRLEFSAGHWYHELLELVDGWNCVLLVATFLYPGSYRSGCHQERVQGKA